MIYLIYGNQYLMVKTRLSNVLSKRFETLDDLNYVTLSAVDVPLEEIAYCCMELPLGVDRKAVVVRDPYFLTGEKVKLNFDGNNSDKELLSYIKSPNDFCDLFFVVQSDKLDMDKEITKELFNGTKDDRVKVFQLSEIKEHEWPELIARIAKKYQVEITDEACKELIRRVPDDANKMQLEIEKMSWLTKVIDLDIVEKMVPRLLEDNSFLILQNLFKNKKEQAIRIYRDLRVHDVEPTQLIALISSQLRVMRDIFYLANHKMMNRYDIATKLNLNDYRVKKNLENIRDITVEQLEEEIERLYQLDFCIKSGKIDANYGMEYYLLCFNREGTFLQNQIK